MNITTNTGESFTGTPKEIVRAMRDTQWGIEQPKGEYMIEVSARVESISGAVIRHDLGAERFLSDLHTAGFITIEGREPAPMPLHDANDDMN